ncbi:MAG: putative MFS family arabinose efflux permease [Litorivivens sp.]
MEACLNRTLIVLMAAQSFAQCCAPIVILLGGIVGARLAPTPTLATLPIALMIVGTAASTIPAALLMQRFGRRTVFLLAATCCALAGWLGAYAIGANSFLFFCVATALVGSHNAVMQQYRFAVAEAVPKDKVASSLSILMLAGVVAAYMGPEAAQYLRDASDYGVFAGSFLAISGFMSIAFMCLLFYQNKALSVEEAQGPQRPIWVIVQQPVFILAIFAAAAGWGVMSLIMTATPLSMHDIDQFNMDDTTWVIQSHIMAMYLPSLFSGFLIMRFGPHAIVKAGLAILMLCLVIGWIDRHLIHYWGALVALGIGWNFLFLGGTTLLTQAYQPAERFKIQALNDFLIFSLQGVASLGSGWILLTYGWDWLLALSAPFLIALLLALAWSRFTTRAAQFA